MADRKAINKYYPPDFDPSKILRGPKRDKSVAATLPTVRLMAPFSMRCTTCGEYIAKSRKFNARKQATGEAYLGIKVIRFYIRCPRCSSEIRFKTDPKSSGYAPEYGAVRNYESSATNADGSQLGPAEETLEDRLDRIEREEEEERARQQKHSDLALSKKSAATGSASAAGGDGDVMDNLEAQIAATRREIEMNEELEDLYRRNNVIESKIQQRLLDSSSPATPAATAQDLEDEETAKEIFRARRKAECTKAPTNTTPSIFASKIVKKTKKKGAVRLV